VGLTIRLEKAVMMALISNALCIVPRLDTAKQSFVSKRKVKDIDCDPSGDMHKSMRSRGDAKSFAKVARTANTPPTEQSVPEWEQV